MKRSLSLLAALSFALTPSSPVFAGGRPNVHAGVGPLALSPPLHGSGLLSPRLAKAGVIGESVSVRAWDRRRPDAPIPTFLRAAPPPLAPGAASPPLTGAALRASVEHAAKTHLRRLAALYQLSSAALDAAVVTQVHDTGRGPVVVTLGQRVDGLEVFHQRMSLLLRRDQALVAIGGNLHAAAIPRSREGDSLFALDAERALSRALEDHTGVPVPAASFARRPAKDPRSLRVDLAPGLASSSMDVVFSQPARVEKVFFPLPDRLVPAYFLELFTERSSSLPESALAYVIAADDGRVLYRADLVAYEAHDYRVWADGTGDKRPLDGPTADFLPHPTGQPDGSVPAFIAPELVSMDGFNKNPKGQVDPWLPEGATETRGNNVDAYTDSMGPDGFSDGDLRASLSGPLAFDRSYDVSKAPDASDDQRMASVTQLFYGTNWQHDFWYDSGFDEAAGNAQLDNYGRGGEEGDPMLAEAQDGSGFGNANMMTPEDGLSPRMQMYLFSGDSSALSVLPVGDALESGQANFGPTSFAVAGEVALAKDISAPTSDGCQSMGAEVSGKIALVRRGGCPIPTKVLNAEAAGALGVLIANNRPNTVAPSMWGVAMVNIPVLSVRLEDGDAIAAALSNGPVTASLARVEGPKRDGALDGGIVSHEWGHFLHKRLVPCSTQQCNGQSEGWGDFNALLLGVREGDDLGGAFSHGSYANGARAQAGYFGVRRYPYSTDLSRNPLTFKHVTDGASFPTEVLSANQLDNPNAEVHNTGEVWASMLFEAYALLLEDSKGPSPRFTFEEARRRMADYVVMGMKLAPAEPTFTEQRDALLAAAAATDPADMVALAKGFAKRGAGSCAVSPERASEDNAGVVESFELAPLVAIGAMRMNDGNASCDADGILDAGERGTLTVEISNLGAATLADATIALVAEGAPVILAKDKLPVPSIGPFGRGEVSFDVELPEGMSSAAMLSLVALVESASSCEAKVERATSLRVHYDESEASSATDTFESETELWTAGGLVGRWEREIGEGDDHVVHGSDPGAAGDSFLESPPLVVSASEPLVISFDHRHDFDARKGMTQDGGVIEITTTGGKVWKDLSAYASTSYNGNIEQAIENPLSMRKAFVGKNPSWPATDRVTIDLGSKLAGKTVQLRFRIGSDAEGGDFGWEIDDVTVEGLAQLPFGSIGENQKACPPDMMEPEPEPVDPKPTQPAPKASKGCSVSAGEDQESSGLAPLLLGALAWLRRRRPGKR
jgi:MYXO-CTERM domain-containing protein